MEILFEKGIPGFENYRYFNVNIVEGIKRFYHIVSKEDSNIGFISISSPINNDSPFFLEITSILSHPILIVLLFYIYHLEVLIVYLYYFLCLLL